MNVQPKIYRGFSLIEMLIGVFIASVGIIGVVTLQKVFIHSSHQSSARTIAMQLVQQQFDTFSYHNNFAQLSSGQDLENPITVNNHRFNRSWSVIPRYYNKITQQWQTNSAGIVPIPAMPDAKSITVIVTWLDIKNQPQQLKQRQILPRIAALDNTSATVNLGTIDKPSVKYIPAMAPFELTEIELTEFSGSQSQYLTMVSSKPQQLISNHKNAVTQFETVIFDQDKTIQSVLDFSTISCRCQFKYQAELAKTPATLVIRNNQIHHDLNSGQLINKTVGQVSEPHQPKLCNSCCNNHHDSNLATAKYVKGSTANHQHYSPHDDPTDSLPVTQGKYIEACRFRRVNGFYQLVPDWSLVKLTILSQAYLDHIDTKKDYASYVKKVVKNHIKQTSFNDLNLAHDMIEVNVQSQQLVARGIYIDLGSLNSQDLASLHAAINNNQANWLTLVPFYEVDLSALVTWQSSSPDVAIIETNQTVTTVQPIKTGNTTISAVIEQGNFGLLKTTNPPKIKVEDSASVNVN